MVIQLDSVDGKWRRSSALMEGVAVIPHGHGEYEVFMSLPDLDNWQALMDQCSVIIEAHTTPNCCSSVERAYEFYRMIRRIVRQEVFDSQSIFRLETFPDCG